MALTAPGVLNATSATRFLGTFTVNKSKIAVTGTYNPSIPLWNSSDASLNYTTVPSGLQVFSGFIGTTGLEFDDSSNAFSITGDLDSAIANKTSVTGTITFVSSV